MKPDVLRVAWHHSQRKERWKLLQMNPRKAGEGDGIKHTPEIDTYILSFFQIFIAQIKKPLPSSPGRTPFHSWRNEFPMKNPSHKQLP